MAERMKVERHALWPAPTWNDAEALAKVRGGSVETALRELIVRRSQEIRRAEVDPFACGWEPSVWHVADALIDWPWVIEPVARTIERRFGMSWDEWKAAMRKALGFAQRVTMLLILGANRSAKSNYAAKRGQQMLAWQAGSSVCAFHMSGPRSVNEQQPLFWRYMPEAFRHEAKTATEYISYKAQTGFTDGSFINAAGSRCEFLNYMQDRDRALEGREPNLMLPDELVPVDWIENMLFRLSNRAGRGIPTFTPINGYTPSVKLFLDGAAIARESIGYMLPRDEGPADMARALGLTAEELMELMRAEKEKRAAHAPQSRPEDCYAWIEQGAPPAGSEEIVRPYGYGRSQPAPPEGRIFETVPRVARPVNPKLGVVWFHGCDNPFGNPKEMIQTAISMGRQAARIRLYGKTERTASSVFARFSERLHVLSADKIPTKGTNRLFVDPAGDRNWYMLWARTTPAAVYFHREWPSHYVIPGIGMPGPWAVPSGRKDGRNDGARGEGQENFGFGPLRYKFEIARLEGWSDYATWIKETAGARDAAELERAMVNGDLYPDEAEIESWDERHGAVERVYERYIDSRAASSPQMERDRPTTLYQILSGMGLGDWNLTPGLTIQEGINLVNAALDYTLDEQTGLFVNAPKVFVSIDCPNLIYALANWLNVDGDKGATKDPPDLVRYYFTAECGYTEWEGNQLTPRGFYYGAGVRGRNAPAAAGAPRRRRRRRTYYRAI